MTRWIDLKGLELTVANSRHASHGTGNGHRWSASNRLGSKVTLFWPLFFNSFQLIYSLTSAQMALVQFVQTICACSLTGTFDTLDWVHRCLRWELVLIDGN